MVEILSDGPARAQLHLLLAHGAGAAMTSPFMERIAVALAAEGVRVHRFEFGYMAGRRDGGSRRPPPKAETLAGEYEAAVAAVAKALPKGGQLCIGGKSMGGRVASLVADGLYARGAVAALVCLGYPFHPIGKPDKLRTAHLAEFKCPALIVQGERDAFGSREEVARYKLARTIRMHWVAGGDHDLKGGGRGVMDDVAKVIAEFCGTHSLR